MVVVISGETGTVNVDSTADETVSPNIKREEDVDHKSCIVKSGKRFACHRCDFATDHRGHYNRHVARRCRGIAKQPITVDGCEKQLQSDDSVIHQADSNDDNACVFPCPCCEERFESATKLDQHQCDDHDVRQKMTSCQFCSYRFVYFYTSKFYR